MRSEGFVMKRTLAVATFAVLVSTLVACGGSDHGSGMNGMGHSSGGENRPVVAGAREIPIIANELSFTPETIQMRAGVPVALVLTSKDIEHDLYVDGTGHVVHAAANTTASGGLTIKKPGVYRFWCTVSGHKEGGMVGTITVNP
jgi:plastocyanin